MFYIGYCVYVNERDTVIIQIEQFEQKIRGILFLLCLVFGFNYICCLFPVLVSGVGFISADFCGVFFIVVLSHHCRRLGGGLSAHQPV